MQSRHRSTHQRLPSPALAITASGVDSVLRDRGSRTLVDQADLLPQRSGDRVQRVQLARLEPA